MRSRPIAFLCLLTSAVFVLFAACGPERPVVEGPEFSFRLTQLTQPPVEFQHGIFTIVTLNMIEDGGTDPVEIDEPPEFPLTATLEYETIEGQKRKVSSSYGYRC